ncbi:YkvA family protein [Anabaenopsis tanganyikae CS-531]|uniref:YkvA family protein n=2 Tax=Anabaenopsis TaxID=110103 RepID=A0ABT5ATL4_9CYAN|nr:MULTISPECIES: YkvA family protein [Anabaenopsis]MDB9539766.1 YkvA family protein [Anabaenopsis arnoldii]MDH6092071.1 YkvA family protein [Anabaenopsis arnoldii]MDH6105715.1 YkvA family protein [Anabaenopsis tanganyikae CS-531]
MKFPIQLLYDWYRNLLRNPIYRWWVILGTLVYILSPIDISPDFIPILGQIDDFLLLSIVFSEVSGLVLSGWKARQGSEQPSTETVDVDAVSVD